MSTRITKRAMSEPERECLEGILRNAKATVSHWKIATTNALLLWALSMLVFVVVWKAIAWGVRVTLSVEIGWHSSVAVWVAAFGTVACVVLAIISSVRWLKSQRNIRPSLRADLEAGQVIEEAYEFTAAIRFQEPEHGGLIYFLRTTDDKVFVLYDYESGDLGARGENPLNSKFQPFTELLISRAPQTALVIATQFSGTPLNAGEPHELSVPPQAWPESETYCKFRWDELERRFRKRTRR